MKCLLFLAEKEFVFWQLAIIVPPPSSLSLSLSFSCNLLIVPPLPFLSLSSSETRPPLFPALSLSLLSVYMRHMILLWFLISHAPDPLDLSLAVIWVVATVGCVDCSRVLRAYMFNFVSIILVITHQKRVVLMLIKRTFQTIENFLFITGQSKRGGGI